MAPTGFMDNQWGRARASDYPLSQSSSRLYKMSAQDYSQPSLQYHKLTVYQSSILNVTRMIRCPMRKNRFPRRALLKVLIGGIREHGDRAVPPKPCPSRVAQSSFHFVKLEESNGYDRCRGCVSWCRFRCIEIPVMQKVLSVFWNTKYEYWS
jgi:hypothetical protein